MRRLTRRDMVRRSLLVAAGTALAGQTAVATANASTRSPNAPRAADVPAAFDETYLGRHIKGWPAEGGHGGHTGHGGADGHGLVEFVVRIDNDDLHVMQNADGTWISVIDHYETHPTPRDVARAAVRDLNGASLVPLAV
ncbi:tyrosinase family oxidase copper chaperone [Streptomyces syringium]|uniref:apotyrosinase chaperone MelC1 n=1 Tax=Streptomyces syringium TaxID=76729 RepID=UPI00364D12EC